jgi:hypothetical protein
MVAEKYAVAQDLDEIIRRYQQEKERGHNTHAVGLPRPDSKKTRQPLNQRREQDDASLTDKRMWTGEDVRTADKNIARWSGLVELHCVSGDEQSEHGSRYL